MKRRNFVVTSLGAALGFPAVAQRVARVGFLAQIKRPEPMEPHIFGSFLKGLRERGWIEGRNLQMDWRFGDGDVSLLPALAAALVASKPDLIVTAGTLAAVAARDATTTIPVVFGNVSDALSTRLVQSLSRPGTNMTGVVNLSAGMMPKLLELLLEAVPATRVGLLVNPKQPAHQGLLEAVSRAAEPRRASVTEYRVATPTDISDAFASMQKSGVKAVVVPLEGLFIQHRPQIGALALAHRIALASIDAEMSDVGALLTHGADQHDMFAKVAAYAGRILDGGKPDQLPVEQPTRFLFVVNRKTERALQLQLPPAVLLRADRVIE